MVTIHLPKEKGRRKLWLPKMRKKDGSRVTEITHTKKYTLFIPILNFQLLHRVFRILRENNPSLGLGKKVTLPPPLVFREGSKRTIFANIYDQSVRLHRPLDHFKDYLFAELGTNGSVDGSNRLILKGRFQQKQLENVVR